MALSAAALHPDLNSEPVLVVVVLDECDDDSHAIAQRHATTPLICLSISARNVGMARHTGAEYLLARDARWLAFTDADSRVAPDWLVAQLALRAGALCGALSPGRQPPPCSRRQPGRVFARLSSRGRLSAACD
jgi:glycosyltransferase involved in cell wall biosynthesis